MLLAVVLLAVVLATVSLELTVPPNPAQFKRTKNTIASASTTELRCWRPADFLSHNGQAPRTLRAPMQLSGTRIMCAARSRTLGRGAQQTRLQAGSECNAQMLHHQNEANFNTDARKNAATRGGQSAF